MKRYIFILVIAVVGCKKESPIQGIYQTNDTKLTAIVMDSTLYLMINPDTAIIYDLHIYSKLKVKESFYRTYNVSYSNSLTRNGFQRKDIPIKFNYDSYFCGLLMADFWDNKNLLLGGYSLNKPDNETFDKIFHQWQDLFSNNRDMWEYNSYKK